jgi:hypothetical protein
MVDTRSFDYPQLDIEATLAQQAQRLHKNRAARRDPHSQHHTRTVSADFLHRKSLWRGGELVAV